MSFRFYNYCYVYISSDMKTVDWTSFPGHLPFLHGCILPSFFSAGNFSWCQSLTKYLQISKCFLINIIFPLFVLSFFFLWISLVRKWGLCSLAFHNQQNIFFCIFFFLWISLVRKWAGAHSHYLINKFYFLYSFFFGISLVRKWGWCSLAFPGWQHAKGIKLVPYNHSPLTISQPLIVFPLFAYFINSSRVGFASKPRFLSKGVASQ